MRRAALILAALVGVMMGCRASVDDPPAQPKPNDPARPKTAECPATHTADGPACAPKFDACGPREIAKLGGGCEPVGIDGCGEGFSADGTGGCKIAVPTTPCEPGSIALPGMTACEPIAPCGEVAGATLFVDATATGGDGSKAKPFAKIGEAIAAASAGAVVAVAAGTYVEDVIIDKELRVVGACPSGVTIKGVTIGENAGAVLLTAKASIERVTVTGPASGIITDTASGIVIDSVRVFGASLMTGIWIRKGSNATVKRAVVDGATNFGIVISGSIGRIEGSHVLNTRLGTTAVGVRVNPNPTTFAPAELTVVGSLLEKNENTNAQALSAKMTIERSVIRDGKPILGEWGVGVMSSYHDSVKIQGDTTIRHSIVEGNSYMGLLNRDSKMVVERTVVRDTKLEEKDKNYGRGIVSQGVTQPTDLQVINSVIERNQETGIDVNGRATAKITGSIIRDTKPNGETGTGIFGELITKTGPIPSLDVDRCLFTGNAKAGIISAGKLTLKASRFSKNQTFSLVSRGGEATVSATLIEDCEPDAAGKDGHGILGLPDKDRFLDASFLVDDTAIRRVKKVGAAMFGGKLVMNRCSVSEVTPEVADPIGAVAVSIESERMVDATRLELNQSLLDSLTGAGVLVSGGPAFIRDTHIRGVKVGLNKEFGDGIFVSGRFYVGPGLRTASLELEGSWIEKAERSGLALFGGKLKLGDTFLTCNPIPIDVESVAAWDGTNYVEHEFTVDDLGGNECGCETADVCKARSTNLKPSKPGSTPKL